MKYNIKYTCRITYGKFSYFIRPEWILTDTLSVEFNRLDVQRRWQLVKGDPRLVVDHLVVQRTQEVQ